MRKKKWNELIIALMVAMVVCGYGKNQETDSAVIKSEINEEVEEEPEEQEPEYETVSYSVVVASENEDGSYTAYDADSTYILVLSEELPEDQRAEVMVGAAISVSTEVEKAAENEKAEVSESESESETENEEESAPVLVQVTAVADINEEEAAELTYATFEKINGFSVEDLTDTPMYASQTVNVRKGPSEDYEQLGSLSWGDEVTVTGIASTGWYQIRYNDEIGYCSNNYIVNDKPVKTQTASTESSASTTDLQGALNALISMGYSEEQAKIMIESQFGSGASDGLVASASSDTGATEVKKEAIACPEFVDAINTGRVEKELDALVWDASLAALAKERAEEITSDFSHNGARNCGGEIIGKITNGDVQTWYEGFYNSPKHKITMMSKGNTIVGAAYCYYKGYYYIVGVFD